MKLIPRTLFGRNALLIFGLIGFAQLAGVVVFRELVQKPRTEQLADLAADYVSGVVDGLATLPQPQRQLFLASFQKSKKVEIIPFPTRMPARPRISNPLYQQYARTVAARLQKSPQNVVWSSEYHGSLWVRVPIGEADYWLIVRGLTETNAMSGLTLSIFALIIALAIVGALMIQRRINRPLRQLVESSRLIAQGYTPAPLLEQPPTEIATVSRAFNQMARSLEAIDQERNVMLAGVSHDLRTPLSKVRLAIEIMEDRIEADLLTGMRRSLAQIDVIIDQFTDYGRASAGEPAEWLDMNDLVAECVASAAKDTAQIEFSCQPLPFMRVCRQSLIRALANLIENAVRHGSPPFTVNVSKDGGIVRIAVLDCGQGLPAQDLELMKQPFRRGSTARAGPAGSGLGLAIVERVAKLHGGRLQLINRPQGGLEAAMELPEARNSTQARKSSVMGQNRRNPSAPPGP